MTDYRLYLFGAPRLEYQGQAVSIDTRKALALLAYLLIEAQPQSRDSLAALLWPESDQTASRAALRRTLSPLRTALNPEIADFGRETVRLHPDAGLWCDVTEFQQVLAECRTHAHPEAQPCVRCLPLLQKAADVYTDQFMAGFSLRDSPAFDDWQYLEAERLRRELSGVLERLLALYQAQGKRSAALDVTRRRLSLDPLNENVHQALIRLYAEDGQRSEALLQYRECVRVLDQELGVAPLEKTTQLYEAVKENRLVDHPTHSSMPASDVSPAGPAPEPVRLVGRSWEWAALTRMYDSLQLNGVLAVLSGESGIGKTRLGMDFVEAMRGRGAVVLSTRCYAGESELAYTPLIELLRQGIEQAAGREWWHAVPVHWLAEAARLVPEIGPLAGLQPAAANPTGPGAQNLFYEGLCQVLDALLAGQTPGVVWVDDLSLADASTLDWLAYLARRLSSRRVFLLVSWDHESHPALALLRRILYDLKASSHGVHLQLAPLTAEESVELIEQFPWQNPAPAGDFVRWLAEASNGQPYFLISYLEAWEQGQFREAAGLQELIPVSLRAMLEARLNGLGDTPRQIIQAAAVIGRQFDLELVQAVSGRSEEEVVNGIESLLRGGLIGEIGQGALAQYDFKNEQLRTLVLEEISLARGRLLHRRSAESLVELVNRRGRGSQFGQIASHYQQAGYPEEAAENYFRAGQAARETFANAEALSHFESALALGHAQKVEIQVELGELYALRGDYPQAIREFETAAALTTSPDLPLIEHRIGVIYLRRGNWDQAASHFEAALAGLEAVAPEAKWALAVQATTDWSLACLRAGKAAQSAALAEEAESLARKTGDPAALAQTMNLLGILARAGGAADQAQLYLDQSLQFADQLDHPGGQIAALNNLSLAQADLGQYADAVESTRAALERCLALGDRHLEAALRNNLADQLRAAGKDEEAMEELKRAVTIFAEIGRKIEEWEPEIWKLVEW